MRSSSIAAAVGYKIHNQYAQVALPAVVFNIQPMRSSIIAAAVLRPRAPLALHHSV
jgi:hypothetical protein